MSIFHFTLQRYDFFLIYANKKRILTKNLLDCPLWAQKSALGNARCAQSTIHNSPLGVHSSILSIPPRNRLVIN